jgi:hypothetical protein
VSGEHGFTSTSNEYFAWRLDTLLGQLNLTNIAVRFRNSSERFTAFYSLGQSQGTGVPTRGTFVGGCSAGSTDPLGKVGVDLSWVFDPGYSVQYVGEEVVNNLTTQHWTSHTCRDIWLHVDPSSGLAAPVAVQVATALTTFPVGCQSPVQYVLYRRFTPLSASQGATTSQLFQPPSVCVPADPAAPTGADGTPVWVWVLIGSVGCLIIGAVIGFVLGFCRRRASPLHEETRERFSSHLLDVL